MEEIDILNGIHDLCQCTALDYVSLACEYIFKIEIVWFLLAVLLMRKPTTRTIAKTLIISLVVEICVCYFLKILVDRPRPFQVYEIDVLISSFSSGSFPSGHTMAAFCAATVMYVFNKERGLMLYALALFIGFTRMYLYAHFPTDVLAGAILGIICAMAVFFTLHRSQWKTVYVEVPESEDDQSA